MCYCWWDREKSAQEFTLITPPLHRDWHTLLRPLHEWCKRTISAFAKK